MMVPVASKLLPITAAFVTAVMRNRSVSRNSFSASVFSWTNRLATFSPSANVTVYGPATKSVPAVALPPTTSTVAVTAPLVPLRRTMMNSSVSPSLTLAVVLPNEMLPAGASPSASPPSAVGAEPRRVASPVARSIW